MSRVLVTGARGFVGRHLCDLLVACGYDVIGTTRAATDSVGDTRMRLVTVGDISEDVSWDGILEGVENVVHLAARVHVMRDVEKDPLAAFRRVNVTGTRSLLRSLEANGVKRLIYLSTIKVLGDMTSSQPFSATDAPTPPDPYAQSKLEAEQLVQDFGVNTGIETVIIRPPLVYGPGVGGNFAKLLRVLDKRIPLPFGLVNNARSMVNVVNLCDLIRECLTNSAASGERFLVSDNEDVSTPELLRLMASSMSQPARLLPVPVPMLEFAAKMFGQSASMSRLTGSLEVDIEHTMRALNWNPPVTLAEGIDSTVAWHKGQRVDG